MKKPVPKLSPTAKRLIKEFGEAAADAHWQQDQGFGSVVALAEAHLKTATDALEAYVLKLQQRDKK